MPTTPPFSQRPGDRFLDHHWYPVDQDGAFYANDSSPAQTPLIMQDTGYQERVYARQDWVISAAFPTLQVTVNEIFG